MKRALRKRQLYLMLNVKIIENNVGDVLKKIILNKFFHCIHFLFFLRNYKIIKKTIFTNK